MLKPVKETTPDTEKKTQRFPETEEMKSDGVSVKIHEHEIRSDVNESQAVDNIATNPILQRDREKTLRQR